MGFIPLAVNIQFVMLFFLMGAVPNYKSIIAYTTHKCNVFCGQCSKIVKAAAPMVLPLTFLTVIKLYIVRAFRHR